MDWDRQVSGAPVVESQAQAKAIQDAYDAARKAYADQNLEECVRLYDIIVQLDPKSFVWYERRGQVLVDANRFEEALKDFEKAEALTPAQYKSVGLLANKGLAHEGLYMWRDALDDYNQAIEIGGSIGNKYPYVLNSRGNVYAALGEWGRAREDYLASAAIFQESRILSSAIFAQGNAALMLTQLGEDDRAIRELKAAARRGPASIDFRAAIAALQWNLGQREQAASVWHDACVNIRSGQLRSNGPTYDSCGDFADKDWLLKIRRWPPRLTTLMDTFLQELAADERERLAS
uniref:Tetratricopeptide repeat protein n=1 Tax=Lotharella oceanica TaxID=641309 RepID=A0A7S2TKE9_9EUKA